MAIDWGAELGGNSPQQPQGSVGNAVVASGATQSGSKMAKPRHDPVEMLQYAKDSTKRHIDEMGQLTTETPGGIFGRLWPYGGKIYTDQQIADAKSAVDRAQNHDEIYQAIRNLANSIDQSEVGTGVIGEFARGMNNTPIPSIGNNSFLGNNRTTYEYPEDDSSWAYAIGKYGGGGLELASDLSGVGDTLKMAKAARFNPFTFAGMLYRDAKQTGKDIVNLPKNIVNGIRNAGSKTSNFVKDSVKAGTEGKSLKTYNAERAAAPAGETAQTGGRAAETAAPAAERTAAPAPRQEPAPQQPAPAPRQEPAPQQPAPAPRQEPAPQQPASAAERTAASETAADGGVSELANAGNVGRETAAGAATGSVSEGVDLASQQLIQHIRSGTLDEMERAWIEAMAAAAANKAPGTVNAATQAILNEARAAGILGRDAAGTAGAAEAGNVGRGAAAAGGQAAGREAAAGGQAAGAGRAGEAAADGGVSELANAGNAGRGSAGAAPQPAGGAPKTGAGEATGTLSNYERQQYNSYISMVRNDPDFVDLVPSTLHRVVGNAERSIDSLSDAELSEFYSALNDAVNSRWAASLFRG